MPITEVWINSHPWMTFFLGMMSIITINSMFVSLGGGYRKFPSPSKCECSSEKKSKEDNVELN